MKSFWFNFVFADIQLVNSIQPSNERGSGDVNGDGSLQMQNIEMLQRGEHFNAT